MLSSRIIPCLLYHKKGLTKTIKFKDHKYIGDAINSVRIFNEKKVDELIFLDIDATVNSTEPDYLIIEKLAEECRMPLCYGGGIKKVSQIEKIIQLGVEKVAISSGILDEPLLVKEAANRFGSQSIAAVLDLKRTGIIKNKFQLFSHNGKKKYFIDVREFIKKIEYLGIGEIIINSIDKDGTRTGYDLDLISLIKEITHTPVTFIGGANDNSDLKVIINKFSPIGAAAGSMFVLKGKYRAVLIQYPSLEQKNKILKL